MHQGLDFSQDNGTPIYAVGDGLIIAQGASTSNGLYVAILGMDGVAHYYLHMSGYGPVPVGAPIPTSMRGATIRRGEVVGYIGSTGLSTGPHLHLQFYAKSGAVLDPTYFFDQPARKNLVVSGSIA
jgi:murein DD-endopeptidase MepM/ murein hydrolase activator NlpD